MTAVRGPLLSIERLSRRFGALAAISEISLAVGMEERRAVIGPNGAGKTTLFNLITGELRPSAGRIAFDGRPIGGLPPHAVARRGISRSFQRANLFPKLPVLENVRLAAGADGRGSFNLLGAGSARRADQIARAGEALEAVGLAGRADALAGRLSYGEQRQLEIGVALATSPRLLLLDEPTAGMSPEETERMSRMLERLPRAVTLLIIEHDMDVVASLADRVTVLHHGEVLAEGTFAEVKADPRVYEVYLGAMTRLAVDAVHTYYGESHVLHGVSLSVGRGEAVALLGRNGAGKTTVIRSIAGFTPPREGRIVFDGDAIQGWPPYRIARRGLALVPQGRRIFAPLSVRENLLIGARASGWTLERVLDLFPQLRARQEQSGGTLSGGEQQMLAIGRALLTNGRLLLLDEPSEGLAPIVVREIGRIIQSLKDERLSILLVEQNYHLALQVADRVYVMSKGQIVYEGTPAGLEGDENVKRRYLGVA